MLRSGDGVKIPLDLFSSNGKRCEINSPRTPTSGATEQRRGWLQHGGLDQISPQRSLV